MKRTAEIQIALDIVRQVLRTRTDWVTQGQVLTWEILAKVGPWGGRHRAALLVGPDGRAMARG